MSLFSHGGEVWLAAGEIPSSPRGQSWRSGGRPLLNDGPLSDNIFPVPRCNPALPANDGSAQNNNGALLYNNAPLRHCAAAPLSRAGTLRAGITPLQCNSGPLQDNSRALPDDIGPRLSNAPAKERNDALPHERAAVFRTHFTDAVHSKIESPILCPMPKQ